MYVTYISCSVGAGFGAHLRSHWDYINAITGIKKAQAPKKEKTAVIGLCSEKKFDFIFIS